MQTVGSTIERDLADEPRSVIKVAETSGLRSELLEYVLTDRLARHFADALESLVQSARPAAAEAKGNCIWLSGFFGSGKSRFAKLAGHVLANTPVGDATARDLFRQLLHSGNAGDDRVAELLRGGGNVPAGLPSGRFRHHHAAYPRRRAERGPDVPARPLQFAPTLQRHTVCGT